MAVTKARRVVEDAAAWLARLIDDRGVVGHSVDAATGQVLLTGSFAHGRAAAVIRALDVHGGYSRRAAKARGWLSGQIRSALRGKPVANWPLEADGVAGTLALAVLAGIDVRDELESVSPRVESAWHAAQAVIALGPDSAAARRLWRLCVRDLKFRPWAPWTTLAARVVGDDRVLRGCFESLVASVQKNAPYAGGVNVTPVPEIALTAITAQALSPIKTLEAQAACRRARAFLRRWQTRDRGPTRGAFPASPSAAYYRADMTAHALLALLP